MFDVLRARIRAKVVGLVARTRKVLRETLRPRPSLLGGLVVDLARSRRDLLKENALLRQQLVVAARGVKQPKPRPHERAVMVLLASGLAHWRNALLLWKPDTIVRWHRQGFRRFSRYTSHSRTRRSPRIPQSTIDLIQRLARENRLWGAERIRGELLKLGINVAKRTVQRHISRARTSPSPRSQNWDTFLRNHTVWACDFLQVYDIWFRPLFAFFIIDVNAREVLHIAVTRAPTEQWTAQQLRNATAFCEGPPFLIRDRDAKFGALFDRVAKGADTKVIRCPIRAPLINSVCERFLGSARRECLDHVVVLGETHLRSVLVAYGRYFNTARPHQSLGQATPVATELRSYCDGAVVEALPVLGGLHHEYRVAA